jgi:hypothetical protein
MSVSDPIADAFSGVRSTKVRGYGETDGRGMGEKITGKSLLRAHDWLDVAQRHYVSFALD